MELTGRYKALSKCLIFLSWLPEYLFGGCHYLSFVEMYIVIKNLTRMFQLPANMAMLFHLELVPTLNGILHEKSNVYQTKSKYAWNLNHANYSYI